jgi:hypothetical protein
MFWLELVILIITLVVGTIVSIRNANRTVQPPLRSHLELFLVGTLVGIMSAMLVLPEQIEAVGLAV